MASGLLPYGHPAHCLPINGSIIPGSGACRRPPAPWPQDSSDLRVWALCLTAPRFRHGRRGNKRPSPRAHHHTMLQDGGFVQPTDTAVPDNSGERGRSRPCRRRGRDLRPGADEVVRFPDRPRGHHLRHPEGEDHADARTVGHRQAVFLKNVMGLLKPERGEIWIDEKDIVKLGSRELYKVRRKFGVLFQDGALFGSMNIYDNVAFPLREHTKKSENEIKEIADEKLKMVGLQGPRRSSRGRSPAA